MRSLWRLAGKALARVAAAALLVSGAWAASNGKLVYSFSGGDDGSDPATQLTFDSTGNGYGTTVSGGSFGFGTVFELQRLAGGNFQEVVLYSFSGGADGRNPYGGVTFDGNGNLYGTTVSGGSGGVCSGDGCGVVFELTNSGGNWTESVLYNFTGHNDGSGPGGGVVFDKTGKLYGTTPDGGQFSEGVVYELSLQGSTWQQTVIHAFTGGNDGGVGSLGLLLLDGSGNLYGVSEEGGAHSAGTVFRASPAGGGKWNFATLYAFKGMPDAAFPYGGLITDGKNNLYGTTYYGGTDGVGTVFKLDGTSKKESVLYSFQEGTDGGYPTSTLVFDTAGNLYGTTSMGGFPDCDCGTVFELSPAKGGVKETILHRFKEKPDGGYPYYGLNPDPSGNLFSTTASGGNSEAGIVFEFTP
ncbi:MAG: choice-of-anchor tandem repeat GloVer-containing protein [Terriglobales bacterium]